MTLRVQFGDKQVGPKFKMGTRRFADRVGRAAVATMRDGAAEILQRGRADITSAGNFGKRWTQGLHANVEPGADNLAIRVFHDVPYFMIHQKGGIIRGRPLLWIPLSHATEARGVRARDYPGGLFRVDRTNGKAPLLLSRSDQEPKYFGKSQVRIRKKFHIIEIARDVARRLRELYRARFRETR